MSAPSSASGAGDSWRGLTADQVRDVLAERGDHETIFTIAILEIGQALTHPKWRGPADHLLVEARNGDRGRCAICSTPWTRRRLIYSFVVFEFVGSPVGGIMPICKACQQDRHLSRRAVERVAESIGLERPELVVFSASGRA